MSLAKFAVSFLPEKGDFVGRKALEEQFAAYQRIVAKDFCDIAVLPKRIVPIALVDRGVMRAGMRVYCHGQDVGWVTSGTMVPYYQFNGDGPEATPTDATGKRSIGFAYISSAITKDDTVEIDVRGQAAQGQAHHTPYPSGSAALRPPCSLIKCPPLGRYLYHTHFRRNNIMNYPNDLKYSKSHEWVKTEDGLTLVGISDFAQDALGDVVFINLPGEGDQVTAGEAFGDVESVKAVSDLVSPVTGVVAAINEELLDAPEMLNSDPYGAWIMKVENVTESEELLDASDYEAFCAEA